MMQARRTRRRLAAGAAIVLLSASLGVLVDWRAPGISRYARDWLMRERGPLPVPSDIAIVAIDEKSIGAFGRFPWPRQVLARAIDALSAADAKVIAVDVLFPDPTTPGRRRGAGPVDRPCRQCGAGGAVDRFLR